jgi:hypothetical protein
MVSADLNPRAVADISNGDGKGTKISAKFLPILFSQKFRSTRQINLTPQDKMHPNQLPLMIPI